MKLGETKITASDDFYGRKRKDPIEIKVGNKSKYGFASAFLSTTYNGQLFNIVILDTLNPNAFPHEIWGLPQVQHDIEPIYEIFEATQIKKLGIIIFWHQKFKLIFLSLKSSNSSCWQIRRLCNYGRILWPLKLARENMAVVWKNIQNSSSRKKGNESIIKAK
jgi:hypothetical protein